MIRALFRAYVLRLLMRRVGSCLLPLLLVIAALVILVVWAL